jgi:uncharacterized membrane protein
MTLASFLDALYETRLADQIRENEFAFPSIETVHVLAISLVVGSIAVLDVRLLGWASRERRVSQLSAEVLPITWTAFAIGVASGALLFASNAPKYAANPYFRAKLVLIVLAGINMLVFQRVTRRNLAAWDAAAATPRAARVAAAISLIVWTLVVAAGRWIGFTMLAGY